MGELDVLVDQITVAKQAVNLADALIRLQANKDFKLVIRDHYRLHYAASLVNALAFEHTQNPTSQACLHNQLSAISHFNQFVYFILHQGEQAKESIAALEEERDLLMKEEYEYNA